MFAAVQYVGLTTTILLSVNYYNHVLFCILNFLASLHSDLLLSQCFQCLLFLFPDDVTLFHLLGHLLLQRQHLLPDNTHSMFTPQRSKSRGDETNVKNSGKSLSIQSYNVVVSSRNPRSFKHHHPHFSCSVSSSLRLTLEFAPASCSVSCSRFSTMRGSAWISSPALRAGQVL